MRRPQIPSKRAFGPGEFERQLKSYALAAAAAGVGILASQSSEAEIVYTKAHRQIAPKTTLKLDLNHDGIADFSLKDTYSASSGGTVGRLSALPIGQRNQIWGHTIGSRAAYASALFAGARVGPKGEFLPGAGMMAATSLSGGLRPPGLGTCTGPWANVTRRYLGLKFVITGKVHFGWARLNVTCSTRSSVTALLTGYAYETVPNRSIVTGREKGSEDVDISQRSRTFPAKTTLQPVSLGRLAQGVTGVTVWREKQ
jgi:hypothetical protein